MPGRSDKLLGASENEILGDMDYVSKSRFTTYLKNPEHFRLKYLEGIRPSETGPMVRGTRIHETFEHYYEVLCEREQYIELLDLPHALPPDRQKWADFIEPYLSNFVSWEHRRYEEAGRDYDNYAPRGIEDEHWRDPILGIDGEPEWMGLADAVLPAASLEEIDHDEGDVIVDFKTGKVPDEKYRHEGIYAELEYYGILFADKYDVVGAAAYYPREDEVVVKPHDPDLTALVYNTVRSMVENVNGYDGEHFETNEGPLCKWGMDDDQESAFYGVCSECTWGVPAKNEATFREMVNQGWSHNRIADELGTSANAVGYWKYKMGI